jgi:hypothetical protein
VRHAAWFVTSAFVVLCASARPAAADEASKEKAESLFKEGVRLMKEEKWEAAREALKEANLNYVTASGLYNLAVAEEKTHRTVEALAHLRAYLAHPKADAKNVLQVRNVMWPELYRATGHLRIKGVTTSVLLDRFVVGEGRIPDEVDVTPGEHTLESDGRRITVVVAAGDVKDVDFAAVARAAPPPVAAPPVQSPPPDTLVSPPVEEARSFWTPRHTTGVALGGLALVAAGVGAGFLVAREGHVSDGRDALGTDRSPCRDPNAASCAQYDGARDGIKSSELGASVAFGVGGALALTSAVLLLWPERKGNVARVQLLPGARDLWLVGTF